MSIKKTNAFYNLLVCPGETITEVLEDRGITQEELIVRTGFSSDYVSSVIEGKEAISTSFAMRLEDVLGVPKSFWLNLQKNYEAELSEINK